MEIAALGRALSSPSRQAVLALIEREGPQGIGELAAKVGVTVATMSHHVDRLEDCGLIVRKRRGRRVLVRPTWKRLELVGVRAAG